MADKAGLPAVLDDAMREAPAMVERPVQLGLLDQLPDDDHGPEAPAEGRRGRPPGARNRRTEDWAAYIGRRYGHPLERLAQLASADTVATARQLHMKPAEFLGRQVEALKAILPYVASPMPQKVQVSARGALAVGIVPLGLDMPGGDRIVTEDAMAALDKLAAGIIPDEIEQLQRVSEADPVEGNDREGNDQGESDGPSKT